jgi:diguanylate cyclase (GGDEF)-like protein
MQEMSGFEVISVLKKTEETLGIPVIFVTGLGDEEYEEKGLGLGAADYISKPFSSAIVKLRVLNQIKIVNQIRTINSISITDQLTGIPNRRGFDRQINREWGRTIREGLPISILLIDVDKFKIYNDTYGHQQGDVALQTVAATIKSSLMRPADTAARWGGEEFAALLPNTDLAGALEVAGNIRENIERTAVPLVCGEATRVTASIGVNSLVPTLDSSLEDFIGQADKALYTAKETGRNRVCSSAVA